MSVGLLASQRVLCIPAALSRTSLQTVTYLMRTSCVRLDRIAKLEQGVAYVETHVL